MKIAVACMGTQVSPHFGYCETFRFYDTEDTRIVSEESIISPGHHPGYLPRFLSGKGADVIIAGGIGGRAVSLLKERGIPVITGAQGDARAAVQAYLEGNLASTGEECHDHAHADSCGGH